MSQTQASVVDTSPEPAKTDIVSPDAVWAGARQLKMGDKVTVFARSMPKTADAPLVAYTSRKGVVTIVVKATPAPGNEEADSHYAWIDYDDQKGKSESFPQDGKKGAYLLQYGRVDVVVKKVVPSTPVPPTGRVQVSDYNHDAEEAESPSENGSGGNGSTVGVFNFQEADRPDTQSNALDPLQWLRTVRNHNGFDRMLAFITKMYSGIGFDAKANKSIDDMLDLLRKDLETMCSNPSVALTDSFISGARDKLWALDHHRKLKVFHPQVVARMDQRYRNRNLPDWMIGPETQGIQDSKVAGMKGDSSLHVSSFDRGNDRHYAGGNGGAQHQHQRRNDGGNGDGLSRKQRREQTNAKKERQPNKPMSREKAQAELKKDF